MEKKTENIQIPDNKLLIVCGTKNGFIQAALQLLSHDTVFVDYFLSDEWSARNTFTLRDKSFSKAL